MKVRIPREVLATADRRLTQETVIDNGSIVVEKGSCSVQISCSGILQVVLEMLRDAGLQLSRAQVHLQ